MTAVTVPARLRDQPLRVNEWRQGMTATIEADAVTISLKEQQTMETPTRQPQQATSGNPGEPPTRSSLATAAFVTGLLSTAFCLPFLGPVAVVLALKANRDAMRAGQVRHWTSKWALWLGLFGSTALVLLMVMGWSPNQPVSSRSLSPSEGQEATQPVPIENTNAGVTMANFKRLESGMTYEEVVRTLGSEGEELSRVADPGLNIGETVAYQWKAGFFGANMIVTFQGGKVIGKAQAGLK